LGLGKFQEIPIADNPRLPDEKRGGCPLKKGEEGEKTSQAGKKLKVVKKEWKNKGTGPAIRIV